MINLEETYRRLARPWSQEQLAASYREADRRGAEVRNAANEAVTRPIASLAAAIPSITTLSVTIHVLHSLPQTAPGSLGQRLVGTAGRNAAGALHHCHRALELDGAAHSYTADEWLTTTYDITAHLFESANPKCEPPTLVEAAQDAASWLSRAVAELDEDSAETASTLAETLGRLLALWVFATEDRPENPHA